MKKYKIESKRLPGIQFIFEYDLNGVLISFTVNGELSSADVQGFEMAVNLSEADFLLLCQKRGVKPIVIPADLNFDTFWNAYDYKERSSKKKCQLIWAKMPDFKRAKAIAYIGRYNSILSTGNTAKKYAETYLNSEIYNQS